MFCQHCGTELADDMKFCTACGTEVVNENATALSPRAGFEGASAPRSTPFDQDAAQAISTLYAAPAPAPSPAPSPAPVGGRARANSAFMPASPNDRSERQRKRSAKPYLACLALIAVLAGALAFLIVDPIGLAAPQTAAESAAVTEPVSSKEGEDADENHLEKAVVPRDFQNGTTQSNDEGDERTSERGKDEQADYLLPDSASTYYSETELEKMSDRELYLARNEIYARHGRGFKNDDLQSYFDGKDWYAKTYEPDEFDSKSNILNDYERKNADLILEMEKDRNSPYLS